MEDEKPSNSHTIAPKQQREEPSQLAQDPIPPLPADALERNPEIYQGAADISAQQALKMQSPKGQTTGRYLRSKRKPQQLLGNRRCIHSADWDANFHVMGSKNNYGCHTFFKVGPVEGVGVLRQALQTARGQAQPPREVQRPVSDRPITTAPDLQGV